MNYSIKNRICVINCFWGPWPEWFKLFIESCKHNSEINWIFFSDNKNKIQLESENIRFIEFTINDFNTLASSKLGLKINIENPYKICDFKPAFGKIFENYIKKYSFWGYCDIDIIFGNLFSFINEEHFNQHDIISFYSSFLSGPICFYRNIVQINELFMQCSNIIAIYESPRHFGLDENIQRPENIGISFYKIMKAIKFSIQYIMAGKFMKSSWNEFRYQFQWFFKTSTIKSKNLVDMTEVVWFNNKLSKIKASFTELLVSDHYYKRIKYNDWELIWQNGKLHDKNKGKDILGFHFIDLKNKTFQKVSNLKNFHGGFHITSNGIRVEE